MTGKEKVMRILAGLPDEMPMDEIIIFLQVADKFDSESLVIYTSARTKREATRLQDFLPRARGNDFLKAHL
jgi:hypothetical protein